MRSEGRSRRASTVPLLRARRSETPEAHEVTSVRVADIAYLPVTDANMPVLDRLLKQYTERDVSARTRSGRN